MMKKISLAKNSRQNSPYFSSQEKFKHKEGDF